MYRRSLVLVFLLLLLGCASSGGDNELTQVAAGTTAIYQVIDLDSGAIEPRVAVPDLHSDPRYRSSHMVFKLVPRGTATLGSDRDSFAAQVDERQHSAEMPKYYVAVFEITQAQWRRLAGNQPWLDLTWSSGSERVDTVGDTLPAYGLSTDLLDAALGAWRASTGRHLQLPSDDQWEYACRAGSTALYHWGDERQSDTVATYAAVYETTTADPGPQVVGSRQPNAFGLYDTHGNCLELTSDGTLRGGSWHDPISLARAANRVAIDPDTPHALVGARLLYLP